MWSLINHKCKPTAALPSQVKQGVVFRSYEVVVDRLTVLRGNYTEEAALFANLTAEATPVISIVVFRCVAIYGTIPNQKPTH